MSLLSGNDIIAAAEWRQELIDTAIPFAVVLLLALVLLYIHYRKRPGTIHRVLFERQPVREMRDKGLAWRTAAQRIERERQERATSEHAEAERMQAITVATPPAPPLGPPTLGFFGRLGAAFVTSGIVAAILATSAVAGPDPNGLAVIAFILLLPASLLVALVASTLCATFVTLLPRRHIAIATACGTLCGGCMAATLSEVAIQLEGVGPAALIAIGALMGLMVGIADEGSRKPVDVEPATPR